MYTHGEVILLTGLYAARDAAPMMRPPFPCAIICLAFTPILESEQSYIDCERLTSFAIAQKDSSDIDLSLVSHGNALRNLCSGSIRW